MYKCRCNNFLVPSHLYFTLILSDRGFTTSVIQMMKAHVLLQISDCNKDNESEYQRKRLCWITRVRPYSCSTACPHLVYCEPISHLISFYLFHYKVEQSHHALSGVFLMPTCLVFYRDRYHKSAMEHAVCMTTYKIHSEKKRILKSAV